MFSRSSDSIEDRGNGVTKQRVSVLFESTVGDVEDGAIKQQVSTLSESYVEARQQQQRGRNCPVETRAVATVHTESSRENEVAAHSLAGTETTEPMRAMTNMSCNYAELLQACQCFYSTAFPSELGSNWGSYEACPSPNPNALLKQ